MRENVTAEDAALALLAEAGDGSMRDALSIMDQAIASAPLVDGRAVLQTDQIRELMGSVPNAVFERLMESVSAGQSAALMMDLDRLIASGNSPSALARQLVRYLRNCLMAKLGGENTQLLEIAQDERARAARTAQLFSEDDLTRNLQIALRTFDELNYRQEQRFHLELGLLKLIQAQRLLPMEEILSGLAGQSSAAGARRPVPPSAGPSSRSTAPALPASPSRSVASPAPAAASSPAAPSLSPFAASNLRSQQSVPVEEPQVLRATPNAPIEARSASTEGGQGVSSDNSTALRAGAPAPSFIASAELSLSAQSLETVGSLALAETAPFDPPNVPHPAITETGPQIVPPPPPPVSTAASADDDTDAIRNAVVQALETGGHATAAAILDDGQWTLEAGSVKIEVMAKATMIRITFNAAAEKLIRQALTQAGAPSRFLIVPSTSLTAATGPAKVRAAQGSIEHEARNHPLVLQAQSIFNAEICSVVDLREK